MFAHVTQGASNIELSTIFYNALLTPLGLVHIETGPQNPVEIACWQKPDGSLPRFFICTPFDDKPASAGNGTMLAFSANSPAKVDEAYNAAIAAGGIDEGKPGPRPHYGEGYYGAYLRDPDGNKLHVVFRGDIE